MRAWMLPAGSDGFDKLSLEELPDPTPGPGEVLIQVHACSLNYRDFAVAAGKYFGGALKAPAVPLSDGAGAVVAVGPGVTRFKEGDRVQSSFFTQLGGRPAARRARRSATASRPACSPSWSCCPKAAWCRWPRASISPRPPACPAPASPRGTRSTKARARWCPA